METILSISGKPGLYRLVSRGKMNLIVETLDHFLEFIAYVEPGAPIYISSEGLSYGSTGDAALNLATYKGVLLSKLYEHYKGRLYGLYTYSPITLKSIAGCAGKNK